MRKILLLFLQLIFISQQITAQCNLKIATTASSLCEGQNISMTATGIPANASLQWKRNGVDIDKAVAVTYQSNLTGIYSFVSSEQTKNIGWNKTSTPSTRLVIETISDIFFINEKTGWAISNSGQIAKTEDGGTTWVISTGLNINKLNSVYFTDELNGIVVAKGNYIFKTKDGGRTWTTINNDLKNQPSLLDVQFTDSKIGWIVGENGVILKTVDGGLNWFSQASGNTKILTSVNFIDNQIGWAVGENGTIISTTNGGQTWTKQTINTQLKINCVNFIDSKNGWVGTIGGEIHNTSDGGLTWNLQNSTVSGNLNAIIFTDLKNGLAVGNFNTIIKTIDGGKTWSRIVSPRSRPNFTTEFYAICKVDSKRIWVASDYFGLFYSENTGTDWAMKNNTNSYYISDITFIDDLNGFALGGQGALLFTIDGGKKWGVYSNLFSSSSPYYVYAIAYADRNVVIAADKTGQFWNSTDGGFQWFKSFKADVSNNTRMQFITEKRGWLYRNDYSGSKAVGVIENTTDGGNSWSISTIDNFLSGLYFTDSNNGFAATPFGDIYNTTDGGATWSLQLNGTSINKTTLFTFSFIDSKTGWVVGQQGIILKTIDGGKNWVPQQSGVTTNLGYVKFTNQQNGWIIGNDGLILNTINGGNTWKKVVTGYDGFFYSGYFSDKKTILGGNNATILSFSETVTNQICNSNTITVNSNPEAPTNAISNKPSICVGGGSVILNASCSTGNQAQWYNAIGTIFTNLTVTPTESTIYSVGCKNTATTCETVVSNRAKVPVTINPKPAIPTLAWNNSDGKLTATTTTTSPQLTWLKGVDELKNITTTTYQPTSSGSYSVRVTDGNGCSEISKAVEITILASENPLNDLGVNVYPNPSSNGIFKVAYTRFSNEMDATMQIIGLDGLPLNSQKMVRQNNTFEGEINASNLATGIYLLQIVSGEQKAVVKISIAK